VTEGRGGSGAGGRSESSAIRFSVFTVLYATALLAHVWNQDQALLWRAPWPLAFATWGVSLACLFALLRPGDGRRLAAIAIAHAAYVLIRLPFVPDHWVLVTLVDLALLTGWLRAGGWKRATAEHALTWSEPAIRTIVIICYAATAIAKHNSDFLHGAASCGAYLMSLIAQFVRPLDAEWAYTATSWATAIVETAIPLLLLVPRTRWIGLAVGFAFHMMTSFTPGVRVYDFAATLFAVWFLFTPPGAARDVAARLVAAMPGIRSARFRAIRSGVVLAVGILIVLGPRLFGPLDAWIRTFAFDFHGALVGAGLIALLSTRASARQLPGRFPRAALGVVGLALLIVSSPYIGGRTLGAFTMFSNLRTEGGVTNHLYLPTSSLLPFQRSLLVPIGSSDAEFQGRADRGEAMVLFEARRRVHEHDPHLALDYELDGATYRTEDASSDPRLAPPGFILGKLLVFRPVVLRGPVPCGN